MSEHDMRGARRHVLVWLTIAVAPAFAATAFVTRAYHAEERARAAEWRTRGDRALRAGSPGAAIDAFRTALTFARDRELRLGLARALMASGRRPEARAHLLALRDEQPGSGPINLELGRLAVQERDSTSAIRYYHDAIEGAWTRDPEDARRSARLELAEFLVGERLAGPAQAELISLADDLPPDPAFRQRVAGLMLAANLPSRALPILRALPSDRPGVAATAGLAAFAIGDDALAARELGAAVASGDSDPVVADTLEVVRLSSALDPLAPRLSSRERIGRALRDLDAAAVRVDGCAATAPEAAGGLNADIDALRAALARQRVADPEILEQALDLVSRVEHATAACGVVTTTDRALIRIARRHEVPGA